MINPEQERLHRQYLDEKFRNTYWDLCIQTVVGCALLTFKLNQKRGK